MKEVSPLIISASRATDIPCFQAEKFISDFNSGFTIWQNPFNAEKFKVLFDDTLLLVFWSKYPKAMMDNLDKLKNTNYFFNFTLNDYQKENFELKLPSLEKRIELFKNLSSEIGSSKVIWRFDPIIDISSFCAHSGKHLEENWRNEIYNRIENIYSQIEGYTEKLIVSFVDIHSYKRVQNNLKKQNLENSLREPKIEDVYFLAEKIGKLANKTFSIQTCSEGYDLEKFNIYKGACIDREYILQEFASDKLLCENVTVLGKDTGQRKNCKCIKSKDIGAYNTCGFNCVYCYATNCYASSITQKL